MKKLVCWNLVLGQAVYLQKGTGLYSSKNVICTINVNVCKISSVGYTADNIKPGLLIIKLKLSTTNVCVKYRNILQII